MQVTYSTSADPDDILSIGDLKRHLRVTHSLEDTLLRYLRDAAIKWVEDYTNTNLGAVSAIGYLPAFHASYFPVGPVREVSAVKYQTDNAGTTATLATSSYHVDLRTRPSRIAFSDYPAPYEYALMPVSIEFSVGHQVGSIPAPYIQAIQLLCGHWYDNRSEEVIGTITSRLKLGVDALLSGERFIYAI